MTIVKKTSGAQKPQRGMALILTMLIVLVMIVLVGSMLGVITGELSSVSFAGFDNRALYSADAGVQFAQEQIDNYAASNATPPPSSSWTETLPADPSGGVSNFTVSLDPTPFLRNGNLYYLVHSEGKSPGNGDRKVDAILEVQSYTHYLYYTYQNMSNNWFVSGLNTFDGPVYLQGTTDPMNFQWYSTNQPIFLSTAIIAGNYAYSPNEPKNNSEWTQVIAGGAANITETKTVGYVPYPPIGSTYKAANQAYNGTLGTTTLPTPGVNEVYMNGGLAKSGSGNLSSGIFIQGNANITMSSTTSTNEIFTVTPVTKAGVSGYGSTYNNDYTNTIPNTVTITVDYAANTTTVLEGTKTATYTGVPQNQPTGSTATQNGSIFVNGNVDSVKGTLNGQYTIAVPDIQTSTTTNVRDIIATGDIKYKADPTAGASNDVLGLMCDNFKLGPASLPTPKVIKIQADIIAGNKYEAINSLTDGGVSIVDDVNSVPLMTSVNFYGSVIQNEVKPMGLFDAGSGALVSGWLDTYNYDTRQMTPPNWPTLGTGLVAWKDAGSPIY